MNPKLIIADECISALDVSIQAQVVNLMKDIQQETDTAYLFIAHDLSMVKYISDRIGVLHLGHLLETGTTEEIFEHPIHPLPRAPAVRPPRPNLLWKNRPAAEISDTPSLGLFQTWVPAPMLRATPLSSGEEGSLPSGGGKTDFSQQMQSAPAPGVSGRRGRAALIGSSEGQPHLVPHHAAVGGAETPSLTKPKPA